MPTFMCYNLEKQTERGNKNADFRAKENKVQVRH